jgi:type VI protein secretion system component VasF
VATNRPRKIERRLGTLVTKNPRDPRQWTNMEIAKDAQGYLAAQDAFRADRDAAQIRRREVNDLNRFTESFVRAGGRREEAEVARYRRLELGEGTPLSPPPLK